MEPKLISMIVEPQDIVLQLVKRRTIELEHRYPNFKAEFATLERKLKENGELVKTQKTDISNQLFERVLQQIEIKQYNLKNDQKKRERKERNNRNWKSKDFNQVAQRQSNRSSETSQMAFHPYKVSNFSKQFSHLKLKTPVTPLSSVFMEM